MLLTTLAAIFPKIFFGWIVERKGCGFCAFVFQVKSDIATSFSQRDALGKLVESIAQKQECGKWYPLFY